MCCSQCLWSLGQQRTLHVVPVYCHWLYFSPSVAGLDALEISQTQHGGCSLPFQDFPGNVLGEGGPLAPRVSKHERLLRSVTFLPRSFATGLRSVAGGEKLRPELKPTRGTQALSRLHLQPDRTGCRSDPRTEPFLEGLGGRGDSCGNARVQQLQDPWEPAECSREQESDLRPDLAMRCQLPTGGRNRSLLVRGVWSTAVSARAGFLRGNTPSAKTRHLAGLYQTIN